MLLMDQLKPESLRNVYGDYITQLAADREDIVVLDADLACSTQTKKFADKFPERFFNMGIAEQDMVATAAGMSTCGKIPFVSTFAYFATGRAWDQIRNSICYPHFNVKIVVTHGGISLGEDGASHQSLEDIALMRTITDMTVIVPADGVETRAVLRFMLDHKGPAYIRLIRPSVATVHEEGKYIFMLGKGEVLLEGKDVSLIAIGEMVPEAMRASEILAKEGIEAEVINMATIKPLDKELIVKTAKKTNAVVTIESHNIIGGLGSAVAEVLGEEYPTYMKRIGIDGRFGQSGTAEALFEEYGLKAEIFVDIIRAFLKAKKR